MGLVVAFTQRRTMAFVRMLRTCSFSLSMFLLSVVLAQARFIDNFDGPTVQLDPEGIKGWLFRPGDGTATMDFRQGGDGYASIVVDATTDKRGIWWALIERKATIQASGQSSRAFSSQAGAQASPDAINVLRRQGMDAFHLGDYAGALRIFRQVIAADPSDIVAYNVSANCSIRLADYPSAIDSFQHALQLRPDEWHSLAGLMRAYTLAGMTPDRDALRKHIGELEREGKLPPEFNYVFETFQVEGKKLEVAEFPQIHGFYGERYRFKLVNSAGKLVFCVTLESDSAEQQRWAKQHPAEAAAGARHFSLDGYAADSHSTYSSYDGEPAYERVREEVVQVIAGKKQPISKTNYATPQPIPGAD
ncbi:MAG: hypothetical protein DMG96_12935 [Acidobacteria bacterium]|nr:MAG: hypothetical protein DMG96_12935 [Acidobacteriota bacterium]